MRVDLESRNLAFQLDIIDKDIVIPRLLSLTLMVLPQTSLLSCYQLTLYQPVKDLYISMAGIFLDMHCFIS